MLSNGKKTNMSVLNMRCSSDIIPSPK